MGHKSPSSRFFGAGDAALQRGQADSPGEGRSVVMQPRQAKSAKKTFVKTFLNRLEQQDVWLVDGR